jgi:hypothetical protein
MIDKDPPSDSFASSKSNTCYFFRFGLIVTGEGERKHLPKLFSSLTATGICNFQVIRHIGQRSPILSSKRRIRMVGRGEMIPTKDEEEIGLPARKHLGDDSCCFVILVDDLEHARREHAKEVFDRYRLSLDTILTPIQRPRASVHFLVNMLEAYYLADARAVNAVLELQPPLEDVADDVEDIRHPKNDLKQLYVGFDEVGDGGRILDNVRVEHILSRPDVCRWLRTLFGWCVKVLERYPDYALLNLAFNEDFRLNDGVLSDVTRAQLESL